MFPAVPEVAVLPSKTKVPESMQALAWEWDWRWCRRRSVHGRWCRCRSSASKFQFVQLEGILRCGVAGAGRDDNHVTCLIGALKSAQRDEGEGRVVVFPGSEAGQEGVAQGVVTGRFRPDP